MSYRKLMSLLTNLVPLILVEMVSRICGFCIGIIYPDSTYGVERRVRGGFWSWRLGSQNLLIGRGVQIETPERIRLEKGVKLLCSSHFVATRIGHIEIGEGSHVGRFCVFSGAGGIKIGRRCAISSHVSMFSISNDPDAVYPTPDQYRRAPIVIEDDVLIGAGVSILPGVTVGTGAVLGAGAVVSKDVPSRTIVAGVPAQILREKEVT